MSATINLQTGQSVVVTTRVIDAYGSLASGHVVNYVSSDPLIAIVDEQGSFEPNTTPINSISNNTIRGLTNGTCTITVSIDGTLVIDTITVIVNSPPPASLVFVFSTPTP